MIHDREYSRSVVSSVKFYSAELRQVFNYLREREDVLVRDLDHNNPVSKALLREIRAVLIWLVTNIEHDGTPTPIDLFIAEKSRSGGGSNG